MEITKDRRAGPKRIGELLVAANIVKPEVLLEALQVAKKSNTPLGRVLMSIGELNEQSLANAIEVQQLLREGVISAEFGIRALNVSIKGNMPLEESFRRLGWRPPERETMPSNELGDLLLEAGVVGRERLEEAVRQSQENNLPLGRCLVLARALSSSLLASALTAQVMVRDGKITKEQAVSGLKAAFRKAQSLEQSLQEVGAYRPVQDNIKVGDLLSSAGIVTEGDKISAIELGLVQEQPVGQVLIQTGMITDSVLQESLKLQQMVARGEISGIQAAEVLRQAHSKGLSVEGVLAERASKQEQIEKANNVIELLQQSGILNGENMAKAHGVSKQLNVSIGEVLLSTGILDQKMLQAAVQSQELVKDGILQTDQVTKVLQYCHKTGVDFHEALKDVAWDAPTDPSTPQSSQQKLSWLSKLWGSKKTS